MAYLRPNTNFRAILLLLLVCEAGVMSALWTKRILPLSAALTLPKMGYDQWATVEPDEVEEGATVPADTNVVFHLPLDMPPTARETLLGNRGKDVRYWGYCFPDGYDYNDPPQDVGFPGKMFLSEAERAVRDKQALENRPRYSIYQPPTRQDLQRDQQAGSEHGDVRQQIDVFTGGQNCYIQTSSPLPIGTDRDDDGLNSQLEKQYGTDPSNPDTDGDGSTDGVEVFNLHTDPLNPDTDGDGVPDGIEVHGHSQIQPGDTDPLNPDSDHDGLCDGFCRIDRTRRFCTADYNMRCIDTANRWAGEDKNLNGIVDSGETDPTKWSTLDDGISDSERYYKCLLGGGTNC
jgi:hypothetical protein